MYHGNRHLHWQPSDEHNNERTSNNHRSMEIGGFVENNHTT